MARRASRVATGLLMLMSAALILCALVQAPPARASSPTASTIVRRGAPSTVLPPPTVAVTAPPATSSPATAPATTAPAPTTATTRPASPPLTVARTPVTRAVPAVPVVTRAATTYLAPTTTIPPTTTTTIAAIGGNLPVAPATVPLLTRGTSAHVSPVFSILSGVGFALALLMMAGRAIVTRAGGRDRQPLGGDPPLS